MGVGPESTKAVSAHGLLETVQAGDLLEPLESLLGRATLPGVAGSHLDQPAAHDVSNVRGGIPFIEGKGDCLFQFFPGPVDDAVANFSLHLINQEAQPLGRGVGGELAYGLLTRLPEGEARWS